MSRQLGAVGITNLEDLAAQVATLLGRTADAGQATADGPPRRPPPRRRRPRRPRRKKAAAKKAPAKKAAAKKAPAKKAAAKKAPAKKARPRRHRPRRPPARRPGSRVGRLTPPARQRLDKALVARGAGRQPSAGRRH